jgi:hypothetical protein
VPQLPLGGTLQDIVLPVTLYNVALMLLAIPLLNRLPESQDV